MPVAILSLFFLFSFFNYLLTLNLCGQKIHPQICKHLGLLQVRGAKCTFSIYFLTMQALLFPLLSLSLSSLSFSVLFFLLVWFIKTSSLVLFFLYGSSGILHQFSLLWFIRPSSLVLSFVTALNCIMFLNLTCFCWNWMNRPLLMHYPSIFLCIHSTMCGPVKSAESFPPVLLLFPITPLLCADLAIAIDFTPQFAIISCYYFFACAWVWT